MYETVRGLVLREARYRDADLILTLLTAEHGKMTVKARRSLRARSKLGAACQQLCYSEFTLFGSRGRWTAEEGGSIEQFLGLREDIAQLALGTYFAELLDTVCQQEVPASGALQLALNALYALSRGLFVPEQVKAVFELRLLCLEGFQPDVGRCGVCGLVDVAEPMFAPGAGIVHCRSCAAAIGGGSVPLDEASLDAMRHVVDAAPKKVFSFAIPEMSLARLGQAAELFARHQLDRGFASLEYWKSVK